MNWLETLYQFAVVFILSRATECAVLVLYCFILEVHSIWLILGFLVIWSAFIAWYYSIGFWICLKGLGSIYPLSEAMVLKLEEVQTGFSRTIFGVKIQYFNIFHCSNGFRLLSATAQQGLFSGRGRLFLCLPQCIHLPDSSLRVEKVGADDVFRSISDIPGMEELVARSFRRTWNGVCYWYNFDLSPP